MRAALVMAAVLMAPGVALAQVNKVPDMRTAVDDPKVVQAQARLKEGQRLMGEDAYEPAARAFQEAIALDPQLMMAHHGLGTARMAQKDYAAAVTAFEAARAAFLERSAKNLEMMQRSETNRKGRIAVLRDLLARTPELSVQNRSDSVQRQEWQAELASLEASDQDGNRTAQPPPGVLLALGSAYFRSGRLADAEREYRATIEAQPKLGEPRINLAVVLLMTGRAAEAKEQLKAAEKNKFKVPPGLVADVDAAIAKAPPK